jgi:hypothetical protein
MREIAPGGAAALDTGPCWPCKFRARCAAERSACDAFALFFAGESRARWAGAPRVPSRARLLGLEAGRDPVQRVARAPLVRSRPLAAIALVR